MAGRNHHRATSSRSTTTHPRTSSRTTSDDIHLHASHQQPNHRPLTPQVMQAHDLHQVTIHQDPSYLSALQQTQAHLISTSLDTLNDFGRPLPEDLQARVIYHTPGMATMERFESTSSYPLRDHQPANTQNPQPTPTLHNQTSVQPPSTVPTGYYPEGYDEYYSSQMQDEYSSPSQATSCTYTYTSPPNTDTTQWGYPLSGIQFSNATQSQNPYPRTINGYNKPLA